MNCRWRHDPERYYWRISLVVDSINRKNRERRELETYYFFRVGRRELGLIWRMYRRGMFTQEQARKMFGVSKSWFVRQRNKQRKLEMEERVRELEAEKQRRERVPLISATPLAMRYLYRSAEAIAGGCRAD